MIDYKNKCNFKIKCNDVEIDSFIDKFNDDSNIDWETVSSFGAEWIKFDSFSNEEIERIGDEYFKVVKQGILNSNMIALDVGCGTGRWTKYVSNKIKFVEAIDPSDAVIAASKLLKEIENVRITQATIDSIPFKKESFDLVFSLGVLHHIPDTLGAMKKCVEHVKHGGYFLTYIYYNLDNRRSLFKLFFYLSNLIRSVVSKLPGFLKRFLCEIFAILIYIPLISIAKILKFIFRNSEIWKKIPLSAYWNKSFNVIRNDSLDRFGTPLEQRFSKNEIKQMMLSCGLSDIRFSDSSPYWVAVGKKN